MKYLLFALFVLHAFSAKSQGVGLTNIDRLNQRLKNGGDTTFIINFWATWCAPCVEELPNFERLSAANADQKLKVLLISVDPRSRLETSVRPFVQKKGIKNEVLLLNESDPQVFINRIDTSWSGAVPATLFVCQGRRQFFEKEFTYDELLTKYKNFRL